MLLHQYSIKQLSEFNLITPAHCLEIEFQGHNASLSFHLATVQRDLSTVRHLTCIIAFTRAHCNVFFSGFIAVWPGIPLGKEREACCWQLMLIHCDSDHEDHCHYASRL